MPVTNNLIKAIVFDLDGVLVDTNKIHFQLYADFFKKYLATELNPQEFAGLLGRKGEEILQYYLQKYNLDGDARQLNRKRQSFYTAENIQAIELKNGIGKLVKEMASSFALAVASGSNRDFIDTVLKKVFLRDYFTEIVSAEEVARGKPAPDIYLEVVRRLRLLPENCVAIEDAVGGVRAAKQAGLFCIAAPDEFTSQQDFSQADLLINKLSALSVSVIKNIPNL